MVTYRQARHLTTRSVPALTEGWIVLANSSHLRQGLDYVND